MTQEQLNTLFDQSKHEEIIVELEANSTLNFPKSKLAQCYFHTERYEKSTKLFEEICEESENPVDWFNLCTSSILKGDEQKGLDALQTAIKLNRETATNGKGIPTSFMRLYTTHALVDAKKYNLAFNQLNELAEIYRNISITDPHFLYMRGIPFFEEFIKLSQRVLKKQTVTNGKDWIDYISTALDEKGKIELRELNTNLIS